MKSKQCIIQFDNGSFYHGWIEVSDAVENKKIKLKNDFLNFHGFVNGTVIKVYHKIVLER